MKPVLYLVLYLVLVLVHPQPSDFLSQLRSQDYQNRETLIDHLAHLKTWDVDQEMELNILIDFIKKEVSSEKIDYDTIKFTIRETFDRFKQQWIDTMVIKSMKAIGLDYSDLQLRNRIKANPKAYSIDYQTYKIITFRNE